MLAMEYEPGDVPDPIVGYACDPVDRVVRALWAIFVCTIIKTVLVTAAFAVWLLGVL